jgi:hypothetical protein
MHYNALLEIIKLDRFYAAPQDQRDKVVMQGMLHPNDPAIASKDVTLTIVNGAERKRIQVNADGSFDLPFSAELVKADPDILTTVPAGQKAKLGFQVLPLLPRQTQLSYASLMGSVPQVNALIKSQAGVMRFLMPTMVGIRLAFPKESHATLTINAVSGVKLLAADANGVVKVPFDRALFAANAPVTLSELPASGEFIED